MQGVKCGSNNESTVSVDLAGADFFVFFWWLSLKHCAPFACRLVSDWSFRARPIWREGNSGQAELQGRPCNMQHCVLTYKHSTCSCCPCSQFPGNFSTSDIKRHGKPSIDWHSSDDLVFLPTAGACILSSPKPHLIGGGSLPSPDLCPPRLDLGRWGKPFGRCASAKDALERSGVTSKGGQP